MILSLANFAQWGKNIAADQNIHQDVCLPSQNVTQWGESLFKVAFSFSTFNKIQ